MCGSVGRVITGVATGGLSEAYRGAKKGMEQPQRKAVKAAEEQQKAVRNQAVRKKAQTAAKLQKTAKTRSAQVRKFESNVAAGGARRAANIKR